MPKAAPTPKIKPLDDIIDKGNFRHTLIKRNGDVAMWKKDKVDKPWMRGEYSAGFEVGIIHRHNGYNLGGSDIEPAETYPSDSVWGTKGFSYTGLHDDVLHRKMAEKKFAELVKQQANPEPKKGKRTK